MLGKDILALLCCAVQSCDVLCCDVLLSCCGEFSCAVLCCVLWFAVSWRVGSVLFLLCRVLC